jgi:hypothetical protein
MVDKDLDIFAVEAVYNFVIGPWAVELAHK